MGTVKTVNKEEQRLKKEKQETIRQRKKEYGNQFEKIIEDINSGTDPIQALKNEAERVKQIKQNNPKP